MLSKIEELEIRVGELVKENHELREAGTRLAKENIRKHFLLKQEVEAGMKLFKANEELHKELEELKKEKLEKNKWYRASDFSIDELKEKLGTGVLVEVVKNPYEDKDKMRPEMREVKGERVHYIVKNGVGKTALSTGSVFYRNWFRVI
nr:MAG TPA: hypothetical protein [Caudoviricetes sp.]